MGICRSTSAKNRAGSGAAIACPFTNRRGEKESLALRLGRDRWLRVPATTFVITRSQSRSDPGPHKPTLVRVRVFVGTQAVSIYVVASEYRLAPQVWLSSVILATMKHAAPTPQNLRRGRGKSEGAFDIEDAGATALLLFSARHAAGDAIAAGGDRERHLSVVRRLMRKWL